MGLFSNHILPPKYTVEQQGEYWVVSREGLVVGYTEKRSEAYKWARDEAHQQDGWTP